MQKGTNNSQELYMSHRHHAMGGTETLFCFFAASTEKLNIIPHSFSPTLAVKTPKSLRLPAHVGRQLGSPHSKLTQ